MNTTTISKAIAATIAAGTCFAFSACGSEIPAPAQDISDTRSRPSDAPDQPTRTTTPRKDFGDEFGTAQPRPRKGDGWTGSGNRIDFRDRGR